MERKAGVLLTRDALLHRKYFNEFCRLRGISSMYQYPLKDKTLTTQGEMETRYSKPQEVWCILNENVDQKTMVKLGWNAEQVDSLILLSVPYDLPELQSGCLFTIPAGIDNAKDRLFRVVDMSTVQLYPASVTCRIMPEYQTEIEKAELKDFKTSSFNLLREGY